MAMNNTKEQLMTAIAPEVEKIEQAMRSDLAEASSDCDPLLAEVLNYGIFNGGKRLRPLLVLLAARLASASDDAGEKSQRDLLLLAIAFEYLHGATLYHDDVIDQAEIRRGKASVVQEFGKIAAILGGDFLHSRSMFLVGSIGGSKALEIFCDATNAMVDGEFLQLRNARNYNLNETDYFSAVRGKTALLIAATCEIGALAGGATAAEQKSLAEYGLGLGTAFQIVDDLLDYQGDEASTGKAVGNDFQEGKMTLPVILALNKATLSDRERLLFLLKDKELRKTGFTEACTLIEKYDGFAASRKMAEAIIGESVSGLEIFAGKEAMKIVSVLHVLAEYVLLRKK